MSFPCHSERLDGACSRSFPFGVLRPLGPIFFQPSFSKIFTNTLLPVPFQKIDSYLGVVIIGAEFTRLSANCFGAEVQGHFLRVVNVAACVARTRHELGAVYLGAEVGAVDLDAELGAIFSDVDLGTAFSGANLWLGLTCMSP